MKTADPKGFTLVEALVAMLLLLGGLLAVAPMFVFAMKVAATGADLGTVGAIAVEQMEDIRSQTWSGLPAGGDLTSDVAGYSRTTADGHIVRWSITNNGTSPVTLKTIKVRVIAPRQVIGQAKEVTLTGLRAQ
ncbi:MAG: prepilin-type N-terminal cleavage/methylation domain-containing protein [Acidobacteriota bacterium]|nr:prepilin-type N-terminal cleavage/methylation domain-containing protein [Acidobacteriota bacterium]